MSPTERRILDISFKQKLSHIGSCLSIAPILEGIYLIKKPEEKVIVSCGHSHLAHAVLMEKYGIIKDAEENIHKHGIHCERAGGCDCSTGSLGLGITIALGMAIANRSKNVWCVISDGEAAEGSVFEALNVKEKYKVDNLMVYCNYNNYGAYDKTNLEAIKRLPGLIVIDTSEHWFIKKYGQESHYKALNEEEYQNIINEKDLL